MKTALVLTLALAACTPVTLFHQAGTSQARVNDDQLSCEVAALQQAPVATQIRRTPGYFEPGRRYCRDGKCHYSPGYWESGDVYSVDPNAGLRTRLVRQCMGKKGYALVKVPRCDSGTAPAPAGAQPPLSKGSCAQANPAGFWQLVTP